MAQLFVPLHGGFQQAAGSGFNTYGESLDRPQWQGAEIGLLDSFPDVWGAVGEAEFHDWIVGVRHPLYKEGGPAECRFLDPDAAMREQALEVATSSAQAAHRIGARYILFDVPWPAQATHDACHKVFEHLAGVQEREKIQIIFEINGPEAYLFSGDLYDRLYSEYPQLSLCVDTGRLGLLAKSNGHDPLALCRQWLPWTRHLHLSTSKWDEEGRFTTHIPTNGAHTMEQWPRVTPAADMARLIVAAQPRCNVVLAHNPQAVSPGELEEAHAWATALVRGESI